MQPAKITLGTQSSELSSRGSHSCCHSPARVPQAPPAINLEMPSINISPSEGLLPKQSCSSAAHHRDEDPLLQ